MLNKWLIRCNLSGYDILQDFLENRSVLYKTYDNIKKDDEIFIYGEKPLKAIFLKCIVEEVTEGIINEALANQGLNKDDFNGIIDKTLGEYLDSLKEECFDIY